MSWAFQPLLEAALSNASPSVSLNTPSDASSASDTTPTFDFTGTDPEGNDITYQLQIDTVNTFDSSEEFSDNYGFANNNTYSALDITGAAAGQSFVGNGLVLKSATVQLRKNNSPVGNIYAKIYAHSGTLGTSSVPTGTALATSNAFSAASVPGSQSNITFTFSGANKITLEDGTYYCLSIEYDGDATDNISLYYDNASPTHPGNNFYYFGGWNAQSAHDVGFVVNTEKPLINKWSNTNTGFVNPDVGGDTDPFTSGDNIQYTVQSAEEILTNAQDSEGSSFGFGEFANVRYRGQRFTPLIDGEITTIGFSRNKGSQGIKVYFDTVTSNAPTNSVGSELYSFTITNANVIDEYGEYVLPTPLAVTGGTEYCFYIAPWDTSGNTYADDYQDVRGVSVTGGGEITNTGGTWSMENLTLHYRVYLTVDDTLAYDTYYWRVRGKDPSGTNEWGDWSTTRSFVVDASLSINVSDGILITESIKHILETNINKSDSITVTESSKMLLESKIETSESVIVNEGTDRVVNGDFETGSGTTNANFSVPGWSVTIPANATVVSVDTTVAYSGSQSIKIAVDAGNSNNGIKSTTYPVKPSTTYIIFGYVKSDVAAQLQLQLRVSPSSGLYLQDDGVTWNTNPDYRDLNTTTEWTRFAYTFTTDTNQTTVAISDFKRAGSSANKTIWIDNVQLAGLDTIELNSDVRINDTISVSEAVSILIPFLIIAVNDTVNTSESVKTELNSFINVSDLIAVSENISLSLANTVSVSVSDTIDSAESVNVALVHTIRVSDAITVAENLIVRLESYVNVSDSITVTDTPQVVLVPLINVSDSISVAESVNMTLVHNVNVNDTIGTAENVSLYLEIKFSVSDTISVTEAVNVALAHTFSVSDTINSAESTTVRLDILPIVNESIPVSEVVQLLLTSFINKSDSISVAENTKVELNSDINVNDVISVAENVNVANPLDAFSVLDTITVNESSIVLLLGTALNLVAVDSISVTENINLIVSDLQITVNDGVTITENIDTDLNSNREVSDSISLTEAVKVELNSDVNTYETIGVAENSLVEFNHFIPTSDSIAVSENVQITVSDPQISVSDGVSVNESWYLVGSDPQISVEENIGVNENSVVSLQITINVADTVSVTETSEVLLVSDINVLDSISVTENSNVVRAHNVTVSDAITVNENRVVVVSDPRITVSETINVNDNNNMAFAHLLSVSDSISVSEFVLLTEPHVPDYIIPKLIMVEGRLAYLVVPNIGLPHYIFIT